MEIFLTFMVNLRMTAHRATSKFTVLRRITFSAVSRSSLHFGLQVQTQKIKPYLNKLLYSFLAAGPTF